MSGTHSCVSIVEGCSSRSGSSRGFARDIWLVDEITLFFHSISLLSLVSSDSTTVVAPDEEDEEEAVLEGATKEGLFVFEGVSSSESVSSSSEFFSSSSSSLSMKSASSSSEMITIFSFPLLHRADPVLLALLACSVCCVCVCVLFLQAEHFFFLTTKRRDEVGGRAQVSVEGISQDDGGLNVLAQAWGDRSIEIRVW